MRPPIAVTIAGSDSGGGAGLQADLKAFAANHVYGASIVTALTAQNTQGVTAVMDVPPHFITQQLDAVFSDINPDAIKIGMLSTTATIEAVSAGIKKYRRRPLVLDPVMVAQSGDRLIDERAIDAIIAHLFSLATLITPNIPEAAALLAVREAKTEAELIQQGKALMERGAQAVLMKGGHGEGEESNDYLITRAGSHKLTAPRLITKNTHGTGCTLAATIAANLAKRQPLQEAVTNAKIYLTGALAAAQNQTIGQGAGPVAHFYQYHQ